MADKVKATTEDGQDVTLAFTPEQIKRLAELADERDFTRERTSRFSKGEQGELDDTAAALAEHQEGAILVRLRRLRRQLLVGYVILALGMGYAVAVSHDAAIQHSNQNRVQAVANTREVTLTNCRGNNEFRGLLRGIILSGIPQTEKLVKEHTLTQAQADRSIKATRADAAKLNDRNCAALVANLR